MILSIMPLAAVIDRKTAFVLVDLENELASVRPVNVAVMVYKVFLMALTNVVVSNKQNIDVFKMKHFFGSIRCTIERYFNDDTL